MSPADAGSKVLAGEPSPYEDEAIYYVPARAFDHGLPDVPVHAFHDELDLVLDPSAPTGITVLDLSRSLALPFPATTPMLLARYCVIRPGERLVHRFGGTGEVHYVLRGHGASTNDGHSIDWGEGDCFSFAGGAETTHRAGGAETTHSAGGAETTHRRRRRGDDPSRRRRGDDPSRAAATCCCSA